MAEPVRQIGFRAALCVAAAAFLLATAGGGSTLPWNAHGAVFRSIGGIGSGIGMPVYF
ncbi:hypothetical protein LNKW23_27920 [Paralimibaculum aggregatum]|uniref:Uncharacterized protein n=1 Tax=Paralimibaculum aggregatum TaxID=3036245 RepID=A0ABQ6LR05_9RHOB|nr:hypothetical protein [Limibaculum sp. NKW23]GMG83579.1 hypothetical protein LNKW23_27920 [Limibaculum sp. NKW23]